MQGRGAGRVPLGAWLFFFQALYDSDRVSDERLALRVPSVVCGLYFC